MNEPLERQLNQIEPPAQLHARCMQGIRRAGQEMEDNTMTKNNTRTLRFPALRRVLTVAAAVAVCAAVLGGTALADSLRGWFADVTRWDGAVTGTEYHTAADEVAMEVTEAAVQGETLRLTVAVSFRDASAAPFGFLDALALSEYTLTDAAGTPVQATAQADAAPVQDGGAVLTLCLPKADLPAGQYTLTVTQLSGTAKAEQPLPILGSWSCAFSIR